MRFSVPLAASLAAVPHVVAHSGIPGLPKIVGLSHRDIAALRSRNVFAGHGERVGAAQEHALKARQGGNAQHRCGPEFGCASCDDGYCCSPSGCRLDF